MRGDFDLHKSHKRHKWHLNILTAVLLIVIVGQIYIFIYVERKIDRSINTLKDNVDNKFVDLNAGFNSLSDSVNLISSAQTSLEDELGSLRAKTSADFSGIIEQEIKGVVTIKTDVSQGSGFLITDDGYVITNAHVLVGARLANIYTYDNKVYPADFIGYDSEMDLALLKIEGDFDELEFGDSDEVRIGEKVLALGNPFGLSFTATEGIISAMDRKGNNELPYYFQTDVSLNPGNSGGPLINTDGEVIGINNFKVAGAEGLGFALESNYAFDTINQIAEDNLNMTIL